MNDFVRKTERLKWATPKSRINYLFKQIIAWLSKKYLQQKVNHNDK